MPDPTAQPESEPYHAAPADSLRVVQLTDTHLHRDPTERLLGVATQDTFEACVRLARSRHWPADLVLLSGDLAHDGSDEAYQRLRLGVAELGVPVLALPGNHDRPESVTGLMTTDVPSPDGVVRNKGWQVIALNSAVPGTDAGRLPEAELQRLQRLLDEAPQLHTLVSVHHPPVPIGSAWMDRIGLENGAELLAALAARAGVRVIVCGHIHQELDVERRGVRVLASPSTCVQFAPRSADFGVDPLPPGYRWLVLHADGRVETGIQRLAQLPAGLELDSGGY